MKSKEHAYARKQPRDLQRRGRVTSPQSTQDREVQEYEEGDQSYQEGQRSTYDYDQDCQEHDDPDGSQDIPHEEEEDHGYQDNDVINMVQATVKDIIKTKTEDHDMMMTTASQVLKTSTKEKLLSKKKTISRASHGWNLRRQISHDCLKLPKLSPNTEAN